MKIESIEIEAELLVRCRSRLYVSMDSMRGGIVYSLHGGYNELRGEIDSGIWATSYLLSMLKCRPKDFIMYKEPKVSLNGSVVTLTDVAKKSCYLDCELYPMFSLYRTVEDCVIRGVKKSKINYTPEDIRQLFEIDKQRFKRRVKYVGNEMFTVMAAIGFCNLKELYCFPWLSRNKYEYYYGHLSHLTNILIGLSKTIILPVGN